MQMGTSQCARNVVEVKANSSWIPDPFARRSGCLGVVETGCGRHPVNLCDILCCQHLHFGLLQDLATKDTFDCEHHAVMIAEEILVPEKQAVRRITAAAQPIERYLTLRHHIGEVLQFCLEVRLVVAVQVPLIGQS